MTLCFPCGRPPGTKPATSRSVIEDPRRSEIPQHGHLNSGEPRRRSPQRGWLVRQSWRRSELALGWRIARSWRFEQFSRKPEGITTPGDADSSACLRNHASPHSQLHARRVYAPRLRSTYLRVPSQQCRQLDRRRTHQRHARRPSAARHLILLCCIAPAAAARRRDRCKHLELSCSPASRR